MKAKLSIKFFLDGGLDLFYSKPTNKMFLRHKYGTGILYMPNYFFMKPNTFSFLFLDKYAFFTFWKQLFNLYSILRRVFFFRLKLKGLGYRIRKTTRRLYRFFFAFRHFYYLHLPHGIFAKHKKRLIVFFSNNKQKLNDIFAHLLLLKKMDFYSKTKSFIIPNKVLFIKKKK